MVILNHKQQRMTFSVRKCHPLAVYTSELCVNKTKYVGKGNNIGRANVVPSEPMIIKEGWQNTNHERSLHHRTNANCHVCDGILLGLQAGEEILRGK